MVILRLKQCERALADGRLDEAFDLVGQPDLRAHRRGQELTSDLIQALVDRGRKHLSQGNLTAAAMDADKAVRLGGNEQDSIQLREAVGTAQRQKSVVQQQAGQALALARRHAEQGQLSVGQQVLADAPVGDPRLEDLKQELAARRAGLESCLKKATDAFNAGDWEAAIDHIAASGKAATGFTGLRQLGAKIVEHAVGKAMPMLESGRLNALAATMDRLKDLAIETTATAQLRSTLEQCRSAWLAIAAGRQSEAEEMLRRLQGLWPAVPWIRELADHARQWGEVQSAMRTSPLSLITLASTLAATMAPVQLPPALPNPVTNNHPLVLHVDGVGSFQILTGSAITIGPRGSSRSLDLPLMIDPGSPTVTLTRSEEDYFLSSKQSVAVNDVACSNRLLRNGDRVSLGPRCRLTFRRPSAASGTALLDLSGARLPTSGVRQAILVDREIIIGPGTSAHIRADELTTPLVLIRSGDGFVCRGVLGTDGNRRDVDAELGIPISVGSLRLVLSREQRP